MPFTRSQLSCFLWVGVGVNFFRFRELFDFHFNGVWKGIHAFQCLGEADENVGYGFLYEVVQRQYFAVNPHFSVKILFYPFVSFKQNLFTSLSTCFLMLIKFRHNIVSGTSAIFCLYPLYLYCVHRISGSL
jgi:hypothetical protein